MEAGWSKGSLVRATIRKEQNDWVSVWFHERGEGPQRATVRRAAAVLCCTVPPGPASAAAMTQHLSQLTDGQRECLRLVYRHMTSKDIARTLGVSPHTVDMRLRTAMKVLEVPSRIDAARLLVHTEATAAAGGEARVATETAAAELYQSLIYQSSEIVGTEEFAIVGAPASTRSDENAIPLSDPRIKPVVGPPASGPPRLAGASTFFDASHQPGAAAAAPTRPEPTGSISGWPAASLAGSFGASLPWGQRNDLSITARLAWIASIAIGSALAFGAILGALEALKRLL